MADAVATNVIANTKDEYVVHLTNLSDSTGEAAVIKVDKSTLLDRNGVEPAALDIDRVRWNIQGFASVKIYWEHTTDDLALVLNGNGDEDFRGRGDLHDLGRTLGLRDPGSAGGTGDIVLTAPAGAGATATYSVTLWLRKRPA